MYGVQQSNPVESKVVRYLNQNGYVQLFSRQPDSMSFKYTTIPENVTNFPSTRRGEALSIRWPSRRAECRSHLVKVAHHRDSEHRDRTKR